MTALGSVRSRLLLSRLYLCTDARVRQGDLAELLRAAFAGGVDVVLIRQPGLGRRAELAALRTARAAAAPHGGLVAVDGSPGRATAAGADLLHLAAGARARPARRRLPPYALVGRSATTRRDLDAALVDPELDYATVGPLPGGPDPGEAADALDLVRYAAEVAPPGAVDRLPWFAAGEVGSGTPDSPILDEVLAAGARRVVVGPAVADADDPGSAAAALSGRLREAWSADPAMQAFTLAALAR